MVKLRIFEMRSLLAFTAPLYRTELYWTVLNWTDVVPMIWLKTKMLLKVKSKWQSTSQIYYSTHYFYILLLLLLFSSINSDLALFRFHTVSTHVVAPTVWSVILNMLTCVGVSVYVCVCLCIVVFHRVWNEPEKATVSFGLFRITLSFYHCAVCVWGRIILFNGLLLITISYTVLPFSVAISSNSCIISVTI